MNRLVVVGKGAALYQRLRLLEQAPKELLELSTAQFMEYTPQANDSFLIFSLLTEDQLARKFCKAEYSSVIIVGSVSAISTVASKFVYSRLKLSQLQYCLGRKNSTYLAFGSFDVRKPLKGLSAVSCIDDFWQSVLLVMGEPKEFSECYTLLDSSDRWSKIATRVDRFLSPLSSLILKKFSSRVYGYNDARLYERE